MAKEKDEGLRVLPQALTSLNLSDCTQLTDECVQHLPRALTSLDLTGCAGITDQGLRVLPRALTSLNLSSCTQFTEERLLEYLRQSDTLLFLALPFGMCLAEESEILEHNRAIRAEVEQVVKAVIDLDLSAENTTRVTQKEEYLVHLKTLARAHPNVASLVMKKLPINEAWALSCRADLMLTAEAVNDKSPAAGTGALVTVQPVVGSEDCNLFDAIATLVQSIGRSVTEVTTESSTHETYRPCSVWAAHLLKCMVGMSEKNPFATASLQTMQAMFKAFVDRGLPSSYVTAATEGDHASVVLCTGEHGEAGCA